MKLSMKAFAISATEKSRKGSIFVPVTHDDEHNQAL